MSSLPRDPEALLRRLEWTVVRRLDGLLHGDYRSLFRGFGLDLADLREYQHNDDVRRIDWNATARLQVPHVRDYQEDREVCAWFIVDLSGSLAFASGQVSKRQIAIDFVTVLARLLSRHGNAIGLVLHDGARDTVLPPRTGRRHLLHLIRQMEQAPASTAPGRITCLADPLRAAAGWIKRRALIFVVSDFISLPGWGADLSRLARRHEAVALRMHDPLELALPDLGLVTMQDAETGEQLLVDTHDPRFRQRFQVAADLREAQIREELARAGVDTLEVSTDEDLAEAILRFSDLRRMHTRLAGGGQMTRHRARQSGALP